MRKTIKFIFILLIIGCNESPENKSTTRDVLNKEAQEIQEADRTLEVLHDALMRSRPESSDFFMRIPKGVKVQVLEIKEVKLPAWTVTYLKVKYTINEGDDISFEFYRKGDSTVFKKPGVYTGWVSENFFLP
mgnify:CR=1 FL=1|tara:strand:- start:426 stop:821 length:396 start_codon:yes stop_codon:yes gene_type:complete